MARRKSKYRPYRTRKQEQSRRMRNIALTLIVIIAGGIMLTKMYNKNDDAETIVSEGPDTRALSQVLEGGNEESTAASEPEAVASEEVAAETPEAEATQPVEEEAVVIEEQASEVAIEEDVTSPEAIKLMQDAIALRDKGNVVAARDMLNHALDLQLSPRYRAGVKKQLANLAKIWLFSQDVLADDKLTGRYRVAPGDRLALIAKRYKVPYQILMEINGIHRPELLQAGQNLKIVQGPFNAIVYKSNFTMDLYLQDKYVKTYRVGLGASGHDTPSGHWRVKSAGKYDTKPTWRDEATGKVYDGSHPEYPLGERYIAIEGLDDKTRDKSGFAIHGTKDPDSIGKRESLGCIRMYNDDVIEVYQMLRAGVSEVYVND